MADGRLTLRETLRLIRSDIRRFREQIQAGRGLAWTLFFLICPSNVALILYRLSRYLYVRRMRGSAWLLWCANVYITGADITPDADLGESCYLGHPVATIIARARIGHHATIYGQNGIGGGGRASVNGDDCPTIGDHVVLGAGATVMGPVNIGDHAIIGARSLVLADVPAYTTVAGVPARVIARHEDRRAAVPS